MKSQDPVVDKLTGLTVIGRLYSTEVYSLEIIYLLTQNISASSDVVNESLVLWTVCGSSLFHPHSPHGVCYIMDSFEGSYTGIPEMKGHLNTAILAIAQVYPSAYIVHKLLPIPCTLLSRLINICSTARTCGNTHQL